MATDSDLCSIGQFNFYNNAILSILRAKSSTYSLKRLQFAFHCIYLVQKIFGHQMHRVLFKFFLNLF